MSLNDMEVVEAQAHVWNQIYNFINSMSLKCAVEVEIPDTIHSHGKPMTLPELVSKLRVHPGKTQYVYRLMRILVNSGFFAVVEEEEEEKYALTPASRLLLRDEPLSLRPYVLLELDPASIEPMECMSAWFQNDDPTAFHTAYGMSFWDYGVHEPQMNDLFNESMACDARLLSSLLLKQGNKEQVSQGLSSLVDVGGSTGTVAKAIYPHQLQLPHVVAGLKGTNNFNYVPGDMFEAIPPADAILLKWILHDWGDEECLKIPKRCKEAIPSKEKGGGKVIIIDMVMNNNNKDQQACKSRETQLFFDMIMIVFFTAKERNEKEWEKLFLDAGFSHYKITPVFGLRSLIEVYP